MLIDRMDRISEMRIEKIAEILIIFNDLLDNVSAISYADFLQRYNFRKYFL